MMIVVRCPSCNAKLEAHRSKPDGTVDCPRCGEPMVLPTAVSEAETMAAEPVDPARTLSVGGGTVSEAGFGPVRVPGFDVLAEIGRGGMGVVYKAQQHNPPRLVALKMILAGEHADPDQLARFRTEAEATARLAHPAIVHIHQVGEWHPPSGGQSVPFLTLEFVDGQPLTERLKDAARIAPKQAAALVRQLARGVHYAHQQGIVHRDLKPSNVLLAGEETANSLGEAKIVDFGLAKPLDGFGTIDSEGPNTQSGAVLGTPSYMAPEQAAGKKKIGPAADVYALGAILYELMTGRPPFQGETTVETLLAVVKDDPVPPRRLRPKQPRDLETICLTCLAKDPSQRYPSAAALAKDLGRFLDGEPVNVRPPSGGERVGRWLRRRKAVVCLAAGALAALVAVVVIVLANRPDPQPETQANVGKDPPPQPKPAPPTPTTGTSIQQAAIKLRSSNNLKQIAIGLHNVHEVYGTLPPAAITDRAGKPLLSWRVAILPYIEHDNLYKQFHLNEPWDSEHNKQFIAMMPATYRADGNANTTHYQAVVGPGTVWEVQPQQQFVAPFGRRGTRLTDITDGTSNTFMVVEIAAPAIWSKPDDAVYDGKTLPKFGGVVPGGFTVALADGSVRFLPDTINPKSLGFALTRNDGMIVDLEEDAPAAGGPADVSGRVTYQGKPLPGGTINFEQDDAFGGTRTRLFIQPDGSYRGARLTPGSYRVFVFYAARNPGKGGFALPEKYADSETSGLSAVIRPGQQTLDFDLK